MRIIAGALRGRAFNDPPRFTYNPMSEKMRGALFNTLGNIEGLSVLDPFGGTGALSFEAVSRGAADIQIIEHDRRAYDNILKNIEILDVGTKVKATHANASGWSDRNSDEKFDLVLMDPPYDNIQPAILEKLAAHAKPGGVIVISKPPRIDLTLPSTVYRLLSTKSYGDGQLAFYRKIK